MRILMLSSRIPYPLTAGFRIRIYNEAKYFKKNGHSVDLLFLGETGEHEDELKKVFDHLYPVPHGKVEIIRNLCGAVFSGLPFQVALYKNKAFMKKFLEIRDDYDLIIGNHIRTAEYLKEADSSKVILDLHDAISYNYSNAVHVERGLKKAIYKTELKRVLKYEKESAERFPKVVIISEKDKDWLKENGTDVSNVTVIPVAVRDDIKDRKADCKEEEDCICFLGKMSYQPNEDAVLWFSKNVMPKLTERYPDLIFYVMGTEPTKAVQDLEGKNIRVTGFMDDPYALMAKAKVTVAPIRNGAGIQNKVLESMVVGTPVVASPIAAGGIEGVDGETLLIAGSPEEYVKKISALLDSEALRESVGRCGQRYVNEHYTWDTLWKRWSCLAGLEESR